MFVSCSTVMIVLTLANHVFFLWLRTRKNDKGFFLFTIQTPSLLECGFSEEFFSSVQYQYCNVKYSVTGKHAAFKVLLK